MKAKLALAVAAAIHPGILGLLPEPKTPRIRLQVDHERLMQAQAKRDRKAAKRAAQAKKED